VPQIDPDMGAALMDFLDRIAEDYRRSWEGRAEEEHVARMIEEFAVSLTFEIGKRYAKVIDGRQNSRSVHSFVVLSDEDAGGFRRGDILKAASWQAPARNFRRGNVFEEDQGANRISWAGF